MANTLATPYWDEIRRLAEQGVPLPKLAEQYGVNINTLWSRASKDDWLLPKRVKAKIEHEAAKSHSTSLLRGKGLSEKGTLALVESWETRAADLRNLSYGVAVEAIKSARGQIVLESASDLKHAVHVARQATGLLDAEAPQIQLSLFGTQDLGGPPIMEAQTYDVDTLQPVSEDADFWG